MALSSQRLQRYRPEGKGGGGVLRKKVRGSRREFLMGVEVVHPDAEVVYWL